ncbi:hypothetical protein LF934_07510 [Dickeya dadantii]|uniref:hypothetical protein n=1 Tax=Dickeya dadantii TaxID=204038 RepID=UPI001CF3FED7|nr:hypothetical protein [Dickeya dadantii]MCA7012492.1 hypothetical protein [Dickeya dadantii]
MFSIACGTVLGVAGSDRAAQCQPICRTNFHVVKELAVMLAVLLFLRQKVPQVLLMVNTLGIKNNTKNINMMIFNGIYFLWCAIGGGYLCVWHVWMWISDNKDPAELSRVDDYGFVIPEAFPCSIIPALIL